MEIHMVFEWRQQLLRCTRLKTMLVGLWMLVLSSSPTLAQELLGAAHLEHQRNAFGFSGLSYYDAETLGWRFHAGDDAAWAKTEFPDSAWAKASPSAITNSASRSPDFARANIGWFRVHIRIDSSLNEQSFMLVLSLVGAAEVYVDGQMIGQYGQPSAEAASERMASVSRFTLQSALLRLRADKPHVLAIRYSFAHYHNYVATLYQGGLISLPTGLRTALMTRSAVESYRTTAFQTVIQFGIAIGMPLLAGVLHLVLFFFSRTERTNLFVSVFSFCTALQACSFALSSHVMGQSLDGYALGGIGQTFALPSISVSLWYVAHALFRASLPKHHWWILSINAVLWGAVLLVGDAQKSLPVVIEAMAIVVALVPLLLVIPVLFSALRNSAEGAYILGVGMLLCVVAWIMEVVLISMGLLYAARPLLIAVMVRFGIYIAIPLALAVVLAMRTARLAHRLAKQNEELEEHVQKRTQALFDANTQLQAQNEQLEKLNAEKNEFLGIAAHDLKNPLSNVLGMTDILLSYDNELAEEDRQRFLRTIMASSEHMVELVNNLLDANRLETQGLDLHLTAVNVGTVMLFVVQDYQRRAADKHITLHYENPNAAILANADEALLRQVLDNLVSNAVKYSPHRGKVYIRVQSSSETVRMEIQDEGPGISAEDQKKLFGKFARLSAQPTGGEHSTGLGLSIVKKLAEAMNGRVWCESEFGKGATFMVELPR
jgi:signal transduction histidine kinase